MVRHLLRRPLVALIGAPLLLAAACGSSGKNASDDNPVVTPTSAATAVTGSEAASSAPATTAASSSPSASPSSAPGTPRCSSTQLTATKGGGQGAAGHIFLDVIFTNTGSSACHLFGYPGMALLDKNKDPLTTHVTFGGGMLPNTPKKTVVLAVGGKASFTLAYSDVPTGNADPATACPQASFERVTPPDETASVLLTADMAPCDGKINVSPVVAGANGVTS
jgi:hypothetical protein